MSKNWPFGFFVYNNFGDKEENISVEAAPVEQALEPEAAQTEEVIPEEENFGEDVNVVSEAEPELQKEDVNHGEEADSTESDDTASADNEAGGFDATDTYDNEDDETLPDLEEELEIALEAAHQEEVKKQHRLIKGITAGVAILGAVGLATGLSIHAYFKKK